MRFSFANIHFFPGLITFSLLAPIAVSSADHFGGAGAEESLIVQSQRLNLSQVHSPELLAQIERYTEQIEKSRNAPGIEWAMWDLARLYAMNNTLQATPVDDSVQKSIEWHRKAREAARPDSGLWREIQLGLAEQLRRLDDQTSSLQEARQLIEDLMVRFPDDASLQIRGLQQTVQQCVAEKKFTEAERICRQLLTTTQFDVPERLQACRTMALNALFQGALKENGAAGVPEEWLDSFLRDFPDDDVVKQTVASVREVRRHAVGGGLSQGAGAPVSHSSRNPWILFAINMCFVILMASYLLPKLNGQGTKQ